MKIKKFISILTLFLFVAIVACSDDISQIGSSLTDGEVIIENDSSFVVTGRSVRTPQFDSRSATTILGHINVPEYGDLSCSYVSQMLSASSLTMPDSLGSERVDSMKMIIRMPRGTVTGDSLAPQQLTVYQLEKQLPTDISSSFNPDGYFNSSSPIGVRNYSMSALGMNDSVYKKSTSINVQIKLPTEQGRKIVDAYRKTPEIFQWPATFNKYFPGIYVKPSFGKGCVANVSASEFVIYYHTLVERTVVVDGQSTKKQVHKKDSMTVFASAPEVLCSNNIAYNPSQSLQARINAGESILAAPAGYNVEIDFPLQAVIDRYRSNTFNMAVINDLTLHLPASKVKNDYGINMAPYLVMVKSSEVNDFFANNKLPDGKTSFWAIYSADEGGYTFTSMREYLINMLAKDDISQDDCQFTIVPVYITTETYTDKETYTEKKAVTSCIPYMVRPTMTSLNLEKAKVKFLYSIQKIN